MVKISVVMPVYNAESFIERAIESINNQSLKDLEVICVDDGSTDRSVEILKNLKDKYNFIEIVQQINSGSGKARNNGMKHAQGEYLAFLDADDIFVDDNALEKMYNSGKNNNADMVGANLIRVNNNGELEENFNYTEKNYMYFEQECEIEPQEYGIPWAFYKNIFKRSFIDRHNIRFPDLLRGQDPVFLAEILTKIEKIYTVNSNLYGYYYNANGTANDKIDSKDKKIDYLKHFKQTFDILDKNGFENISDAYKNSFITVLKVKERNHDDEYVELLFDTFNNLEKYFKEDSYPHHYLSIIKPSKKSVSSEKMNEILKTKEEFINTTLTNNEFIDLNKIKEYNLKIEQLKDNEDFIKSSYFQVYDMHKNEQEQYNTIKKDITSLSDEINELNDSNNEILSSNAWKYTKFLRDIKHYLK